jgi:hypothetical protein
MIAAGMIVYMEFCPDTSVGGPVDEKMVAAIYRAMEHRRLGLQSLQE